MRAAAKNSQITGKVFKILERKALLGLGYYLKEKCESEHYQESSFKYFVNTFYQFPGYYMISTIDPEDNFKSNS